MVSWKDAATPSDSQGMAGALGPTGAICGSYDEGAGTRICVDHWLLQLEEESKKRTEEINNDRKKGQTISTLRFTRTEHSRSPLFLRRQSSARQYSVFEAKSKA